MSPHEIGTIGVGVIYPEQGKEIAFAGKFQPGEVVEFTVHYDKYYTERNVADVRPASPEAIAYVEARLKRAAGRWFRAYMNHHTENSLLAYEEAIEAYEAKYRKQLMDCVTRWSPNYVTPKRDGIHIGDGEQKWFDDDKYI